MTSSGVVSITHRRSERWRRSFLVLLILLAGGTLPPQVAAQELEVGAKLGVTRASEITDRDYWWETTLYRQARSGGVFVRWQLGPWAALKGEAALAPRGHVDGDYGFRSLSANYLELPVLLELTALRIGPAGLEVQAGIAPGFLRNCVVTYEESYRGDRTEPCSSSEVEESSWDPRRGHDLSLHLGSALRLPLEGASFSLEIRATRSIHDGMGTTWQRKTFHESISLSIAHGRTLSRRRGGG